MADAGLYSTLRCRHPKSLTDSRLARQGDYPNLVKHQSFKPFEALSSDITQTTTSEGKAYICQIRDLTSNLVLAHQISNHMDTDLVLATLKQAHQRWALPETCIFHSDRGSQYTAKGFWCKFSSLT
ncbi:transposase [Lacticaseibacillus paracasei]|nr:transposase [Lacticaseibacillus paracasei]